MSILKPNAQQFLKQDHTPEQIIAREEEQQKLRDLVFNPVRNNKPGVPTVYIYGSNGTGKTVTATKELYELKSDLDPDRKVSLQYINGRKYETYYQVLVKMIDNLSEYLPVEVRGDTIDKVHESGWSASYVHDIFKAIVENREVQVILVLDEIDKLRLDGSEQVLSMFHDLASSYEGNLPVSLVAISNDPYLLDEYSGDIDRRISDKMHFASYNAEELKEILEVYAQLSLREGTYDQGDLAEIAATISQSTGSATKAKKLLYHIGSRSNNTINLDYLEDAEEEANKNMLKKEIESKPPHHIAALRAIALANEEYSDAMGNGNNGAKQAPTTSNVYEKYKEVIGKYTDPNSQRSLINYVNELEKDSLISTNVKGLGRGRGLSKLHSPTADPGIIKELTQEALENRYGYVMEERVQSA